MKKLTQEQKAKAFDAIWKWNDEKLGEFAEWRDKVQKKQGDRRLPDGAEQRCDVHLSAMMIMVEGTRS